MFGRNTAETSTSGNSFNGLIKIGIIAVIVIVVAGIFMNANNTANRYERQLEAQYKNNQNYLSQYGLQMYEAAGVTSQYKEDFIELVKAEMEGRYGEPSERKQALANWVQERNLSFDSALYTKLQAMIESGRNEFKRAQSKLLDIRRDYETVLGNWPGGWIMNLVGYPKVDLAKYDPVLSTDVINTYQTGIEKPVDMFKKN